jgi:4-hydroxybenzoate polyprenyltransferase
MKDRLTQYAQLMRLDRPIGIFLLMWPMLWALWIASKGNPNLLVLLVFASGVVLMRSAGCVINDYADRKFDPHVERTRDRPIAAGRVKPKEALALFAALCLTAFGLVLLMNRLTIMLSFAGVVLAALYPFMKRFTHLPQVFLGMAFGWAVPMAFAAQTGEVPKVAWLLFVATVLEADRAIIATIQILLLAALLMVGQTAGLGGYYYFGLLLAAGLALYQQYLIREREPRACFQAFLNNNWFGAAVFTGIFLDYLVRVPA